MKKNILLIMILSSAQAHGMQENLTPEQAANQAREQLYLLQADLAGHQNCPQAQGTPPAANQRNIELSKQRIQGPAFQRLCAHISAGRERLHAQRTTQEAIAHISLAAAAAEQIALQDNLIKKTHDLDQEQLRRQETEEELGVLQEIKQLKERQKQELLAHGHATAHLQFLKETIQPLDDKLSQLCIHLNILNLELDREIIAAQQAVRALKNS